MKTPDYLSYDRYKNKKETNPKRRFFLFIGTFFISMIVFFFMANLVAPDVDVTIGNEPELEEKNIGLGIKQFVDSRLKSIDLEDLGKSESHSEEISTNNSKEIEEEEIELPKPKEDNSAKINEEPMVMPAYEAPRPDNIEISKQIEQPSISYKVYVGKYSNSTQAKVVKDILMDSDLDISPFIKNINGIYTLQIGSFLERTRAEQVSNDLIKNGFPSRIVQE